MQQALDANTTIPLTTTLAVTNLFRYAGWVAAIIGSVLYAGFQITLWGPTESVIVNTGVAAVGLIGAVLLSSTINEADWDWSPSVGS